jgi:hypothetical protein
MNRMKTFAIFLLMSSLVTVGVNTRVAAENAITYSPEQWPSRWASGMRQQQNGRYPDRRAEHVPSDEPDRSVSEDDLFLYPPDGRRHYRQQREQFRSGDRRSRYEDRESRFNQRRDAIERERDRHWSTAYGDFPRPYPYAGNMPYAGGPNPYGYGAYGAYPYGYGAYGAYPYGYGLYGGDPLLGFPPIGFGNPLMFGPTYGYPLLGYPGMGSWGAPYGW